MWAVWVFLLWQADYCGWPGRCGWPPVLGIARPCIVWNVPAAGGSGWVMRHLAVGP